MSNRLTEISLGIALIAGGLASCQPLSGVNLKAYFPSTSASQPPPSRLADPNSLAALEQAVHRQVNQYRRSRQLPPLELNAQISQQARIHSERMASGAAPFSHEGLEGRSEAIGTALPYQAVAENLAKNRGVADPATAAVSGWIESSGHRQNLEGKFDLTGIGAAHNSGGEYYFTQIFIRQPPASPSPKSPSLPERKSEQARPTPSPPLQAALLVTLEQEIQRQVNQYRLARNLPSLRLDPRLSEVARRHSQDMAQGTAAFSHDGFDRRVREIGRIVPYRKAGENLAVNKGYADPVAVSVRGWIDSPGHRRNLEGEFDLTGIGVAKNPRGEYYFTQLFVLER